MKSSIFITIFCALLLVFSASAEYVFTPEERDVKNYEQATNVKKNIAYHGERLLDVYYNKKKTNSKKKVVIHIFGSSWIFGDKIGQTKIGSLLEEEGYVAVVPNYVLFPKGTIEDMVDDIYNVIQWTYKNISKYGGNPKKISICAHSAGAHVTALTLIKSTLNMENNGVTLKKLPALKKIILLNGPYSFDQEFLAYTLQGSSSSAAATTEKPSQNEIEKQLVLQKLMTTYLGDESISPVSILKKQEKNSVKFDVEKFIFFYTSDDTVVPESSAKNLISEISRTSKTSFEYIYEEDLGHATVTDGVRAGIEEYNQWYMDLIQA